MARAKDDLEFAAMTPYLQQQQHELARLEEKLDPLVERLAAVSEQGKQIAVQGRQIAEQFSAVSNHLSTATMHFSESLAIIKNEVGELTELVSDTALEAREKVELVSQTIERTHRQVASTTDFIQAKVIEPARELAISS